MLVLIWVLTGHWLLMDGTCGTREAARVWRGRCCASNGLPLLRSVGHGLVRGHDRLRAAAQSEGVVPAAVGVAHLRCVLGEMRTVHVPARPPGSI